MPRKKYRYILNGVALGSDKIGDFRLIGANNIKPSYHGYSALRVQIPDDLELEKWKCDSYSTTRDERTLDELGYDVMLWNEHKKKWEIYNELKGIRPCDFPIEMRMKRL